MSILLRQLIASFSSAEHRRVIAWLSDPVHNQREDIRLHYQVLSGGNAPPSSGTRSAGLRSLEYHLMARLEDYLVYRELSKNNPSIHRRLLLDAYASRGLEEHLKDRLKKMPVKATPGEDPLLLNYHVQRQLQEVGLSAHRGGKGGLSETADALESYVIYLQLRQASAVLARNRVINASGKPIEIPRLEEILASAARPFFQRQDQIRAFYLCVHLQRQSPRDAETTFTSLHRLLEDSTIHLHPTDRYSLLLVAINHGLRRINQGEEGAARFTLSLYQLGLADGSLFTFGKLSPFAFNNIVAISIHLGEAEWAGIFIDTHAHRIPLAKREEIVTLARARLAYFNGEHGDALGYLQHADWQDFIHLMTARILQMKIYFSESNFNLLDSHLTSTTRLLSRRRVTASYHHENYTNIFRLARALLRLPPGNSTTRSALREEINKTTPCTEKQWLLDATEQKRGTDGSS